MVSSSRFRLKPWPAFGCFQPTASNGLIRKVGAPLASCVFMIRIVRCPRNDTSPRELIASSHRRSPLTRGHPRCGFTTRTGKVARRRPRENKKKFTRPVEVDDSPLASRRILDAPDGCKPPSGLPVHSRVRLLLVSLVGGVGESRLAVIQRAPARGYGWSVSRKSVDRVGARVARRGARV